MLLGMGDINTLATQIQKIEGYYPPGTPGYPNGSLAWQNNNPGNIRFANQPGAVQGAGGFAKWPTYDAGYQGLLNQINYQAAKGQDLSQFINQYAPPTENNTNQYLASLVQATGASPTTPLTTIIGAPPGISLPPTVPALDINPASGAIATDYFPSSDSADDSGSYNNGSQLDYTIPILAGVAGLALFAFTR